MSKKPVADPHKWMRISTLAAYCDVCEATEMIVNGERLYRSRGSKRQSPTVPPCIPVMRKHE